MADIFADLLAQYLGSGTVVQPLLPSFFAPMPPLAASDATLLPPDEHAVTPTEALFFTDETRPLPEQEGIAVQTDVASRTSPHMSALSSTSALTSLLSDNTPVIPLRQLLHVPHVDAEQNEPGQRLEHPRGTIPTEIAPILQPKQIWEYNVHKDEAAEVASLSRDTAQIPSSETWQQTVLQERQQQTFRQRDALVRKDEIIGSNDKHISYQPEHVASKTTSQAPKSVKSILLPSRLSLEPIQQPSAQIQPQTSTASAFAIEREASVQGEHLSQLAEQQTRLAERLTFTEPQIAPLARSILSVRAALSSRAELSLLETFPSDTPNAPHTSASLVVPDAVKQLAHALLPAPTRPKDAEERPGEHPLSHVRDVRSEPLAPQALPKQEATVSTEEHESQPIRIHIGRVVVRGAVDVSHSTTKPSAKRTLRPTLSLNEYLKQRERGSR